MRAGRRWRTRKEKKEWARRLQSNDPGLDESVLISPPDVAIDHLFPPYTQEKVQALNQWFDY
jgi:hypothetical protein